MVPITNITGRLGNQMFQTAYIYSQMRKGNIPDIYVQSPEYFEDYKNEIIKMFSDNIVRSDYVGIQVRRGDYVNNPFYVDNTLNGYYKRAMDLFPGEKFLVTSDDIEWCKQSSLFEGCEFMEENDLDGFNRLAGCKAVISANSSYGWWAGYLCGGTVVAPANWYTDRIERTKCPEHWIRI